MNKGDVWPLSLRLVHWASAALVFAALGLGTYMVQLVHDPAERFELTQTHKSIGITAVSYTHLDVYKRQTYAARPRPAWPRSGSRHTS